MRLRTFGGIVGAVLFVVAMGVVGSPAASAGKPGGGGGTVDGGTVYYGDSTTWWQMNPDGSGKRQLPAGVGGDPSRKLHGGYRWFVHVETVPGLDVDGESLKGELVAVRADGLKRVQLTPSGDSVMPDHAGTNYWSERSRWAGTEDTLATYLGYTLGANRTPETWGVWTIAVSWDANGEPVPGAQTLVQTPNMYAPYKPNTVGWRQRTFYTPSPDGTELAFSSSNGTADFTMCRVVLSTGVESAILPASGSAYGWVMDWSSTGRILYQPSIGGVGQGLHSMAPDGASVRLVVPPPTATWRNVGDGFWSPAGTHLVYLVHDFSFKKPFDDTHRVAADGTGDVNLTGDVSVWASPWGWRANN